MRLALLISLILAINGCVTADRIGVRSFAKNSPDNSREIPVSSPSANSLVAFDGSRTMPPESKRNSQPPHSNAADFGQQKATVVRANNDSIELDSESHQEDELVDEGALPEPIADEVRDYVAAEAPPRTTIFPQNRKMVPMEFSKQFDSILPVAMQESNDPEKSLTENQANSEKDQGTVKRFKRRYLFANDYVLKEFPKEDSDGSGSVSRIDGPVGTKSGFISPPVKSDLLRADQIPLWLSVHGQTTVVTQGHGEFRAPYTGTQSLKVNEGRATSETATVFLDANLWHGTEVIFNPEIAGGTGLSGVNGIAGFPNGEITRVGLPQPSPYIARLLLRQTFGLGGETEVLEEGANQVAMTRDVNRFTLFIGKMALTDIFDNNRHSHDPRTQLMNWSMMYNGAWDYPADVRGYNYGIALDYNEKDWGIRYGIFGEPNVANGTNIDSQVLNANGQVIEFERRVEFNHRPGSIRLLGFLNRAHMGSYRQALSTTPVDPDITQSREFRIKYGFGANYEQDVTEDIGIWARAGWNDGQTESWAFTEIDNTISMGMLVTGDSWKRPQDEIGLGIATNGISDAHRDYLAAGGVGFILGDGRLNYARENIIETYYNLRISNTITVTGDIQGIQNPGYNHDRGPVCVAGVRVHVDF